MDCKGFYKTLRFFMYAGPSRHCTALRNKRMADKEFICTWSEKYPTHPFRKSRLMPSLHIKLGLMKNFVKAMAKQNSNGFEFLCKKFPKLSQAKMKEEIFVGPQIRKVCEDLEFEH